MPTFDFRVGPASAGAFDAFGFESLDELEEGLVQMLAEHSGSLPEFSFRPEPGPPYTVAEAFEVAVQVLGPSAVPSVQCVFASERAQGHAARMLPSSERLHFTGKLGCLNVEVTLGDLTRARADAVVNASNTQLKLGSGVSGAIRRAASNPDALQGAMLAKGPIAPGGVATTPSWLPNSPVMLHAATASGGEEVVRRALVNVLAACAAQGLATVALPALGCGTGGLSVARFAALTREVLAAYSGAHPTRVQVVLFDAGAFGSFCDEVFPGWKIGR